ncbi:hypothetical protein E2C01_009686 [Portunus trituberculatus]|uniref:Uncharacterized protein n=1 Tax=Portunus trituberculatus TaxID=210409 RepID=A0A5B7D6E5_PORTR|nr:hypothetical protein [Portunus trituberculatus]
MRILGARVSESCVCNGGGGGGGCGVLDDAAQCCDRWGSGSQAWVTPPSRFTSSIAHLKFISLLLMTSHGENVKAGGVPQPASQPAIPARPGVVALLQSEPRRIIGSLRHGLETRNTGTDGTRPIHQRQRCHVRSAR